jgi:predicted dehydrogenase
MIGAGWRSPYFLAPASKFGERFEVTGVVVRSSQRAAEVEARWGLTTFTSLDAALAARRPDFAVVAVPWSATPEYIRDLVAADIPVLAETPPAPDLPALRQLWRDVGGAQLVQVAEQYHLYPGHQARAEVIRSGRIGRANEVQLTSSHQYHMTSLMRFYLDTGFEPAAVTGFESVGPLANPIDPDGWRDDTAEVPIKTTQAHIAFASGKTAMYDFTENQWWNPLRVDRALIRGSRGEISDDRVTSLHDARTVVTTRLERWQTGLEMNLEGFDLGHISLGDQILYRNRWQGGRLADDEIAAAEILEATGDWARQGCGPGGPYPLAQGCQDHALALAIDQSIAEGRPVQVGEMPWAQ